MGSNAKVGRHAKPSTNKAAKVAAYGAVAATIPVAGLVFSGGSADAATATQWNCIAQFESAGNWHIESGDPPGAPGTGASAWGGGLQFQPASWSDAMGILHGKGISTAAFGSHASNSTKQQQILAAEALESVQGPSAWATNGMSSCATLSPSMFKGGPNPWAAQGYSGTQVPPSVIDGTSGDNFAGGTPPVVTPPPVNNPPASDGGQYTVKAGDTLFAIAAAHGVTLEALEAANPQIVNFDLIEIGDRIDIPGTPPVVTPPATTPHHWANCTDARRHGWHDFRRASSGYRPALDGDHDGIACESGGWHTTPPPVVVPPTDPALGRAPAECDHIVVHGDTVSAVAAAVGAPLADVEAVNPGIIAGDRPDNYSLIFAGGHIHMPAGYCATGA